MSGEKKERETEKEGERLKLRQREIGEKSEKKVACIKETVERIVNRIRILRKEKVRWKDDDSPSGCWTAVYLSLIHANNQRHSSKPFVTYCAYKSLRKRKMKRKKLY